MLLCLLLIFPLLMLWLGVRAALRAKHLAQRHQENQAAYPTAEVLRATFEAEQEGVWPPKPAVELPE